MSRHLHKFSVIRCSEILVWSLVCATDHVFVICHWSYLEPHYHWEPKWVGLPSENLTRTKALVPRAFSARCLVRKRYKSKSLTKTIWSCDVSWWELQNDDPLYHWSVLSVVILSITLSCSINQTIVEVNRYNKHRR